jgi:amino acid permease
MEKSENYGSINAIKGDYHKLNVFDSITLPDRLYARFRTVSASRDNIVPREDDEESRVSTNTVAIFSILNTIVGGGVLSLPYAVAQAGWLQGLVLMFISVLVSIESLQILLLVARKVGAESYSDLMRKSLGFNNFPEYLNMVMLILLVLVMIAFNILMKDLAGALYSFAFTVDCDNTHRNIITTMIFLCIIFPLMCKESLHELRFVSYLGVTSIMFLLVTLVYKSAMKNIVEDVTLISREARAGPNPQVDHAFLISIPIIFIAFLCQFNVIEVFGKMKDVSLQSSNHVVYTSMIVR